MKTIPTIHVVDDDPAMISALCMLVKAMGYEVESHDSAEVFLENYRPRGTECLVLDIRLPGMSGLELQRELTRRGYYLPIIFITGHGSAEIAAESIKQGGVSFLEKPFSSNKLRQSIREAIALVG